MENNLITRFKKDVANCLKEEFDIHCSIKALERGGDFVLVTKAPVDLQNITTLKEHGDLNLPIQDVTFERSAILNLDRSVVFLKGLDCVLRLKDRCGTSDEFKDQTVSLNVDTTVKDELLHYRMSLLVDVTRRLAEAAGYSVFVNDTKGLKLCFTHKSLFDSALHDRTVLCGIVSNAEHNSLDEYKKLKLEKLWNEGRSDQTTAENLVDAAIKFKFLSHKPNYVISLADNSFDSIATFILYNYSRLNVLIHKFEESVLEHVYPPLPLVNEVDFSVLQNEKEWRLLFNFVMQYPEVVSQTVCSLTMGKPAVNLLCNFLHALARTFSSYYRSTKILLKGRSHLLQTVFARIYLIKAVHQVLHNGLLLLSIKPIPVL